MICPTIRELPPPPPGKYGWPWTEESSAGVFSDAPSGSWPKISIVTPSYNQGRFIEETIRSVLLQGYPDLEYIIMDGGSTDDTVEIIRKYEPWLAYWTSKKDNGQSHAINKGWSRASGDLIAWLNSDDTYAPGGLRHVAEYFRNHDAVSMTYGDCHVIDEKGAFVKSCPTETFTIKDLICNKWIIPQQSAFIRRNVAESLGKLREDLHLVMDWEYWVRIALQGHVICYVPGTVSQFRIWADAKTSSQSVRSAAEKISVLDEYFGNKEFSTKIRDFKRAAYGSVYFFAGTAYYRNDLRWKAFSHLVRSAWYAPSLLKERKILKMIALLATGKSLNRKRRELSAMLMKTMGQSR